MQKTMKGPLKIKQKNTVKAKLSAITKRLEIFFENRRNEATYLKALPIFIISVFLHTIWFTIPIGSIDVFYLMKLNPEFFISKFLTTVFWMSGFYSVFLISYRLVGDLIFKLHMRFKEIIYIFSILLMISFIHTTAASFLIVASHLFLDDNLISPILTWLFILTSPIMLYIGLIGFGSIHKFDYTMTIKVIVTSAVFAQLLAYAFIVFSLLNFIVPLNATPQHYNYSITTNEDGSITASYAWVSNSTNKTREICYVGFPKGFKTFFKTNPYRVVNEDEKIDFWFVHAPPQDWGNKYVKSGVKADLRDMKNKKVFDGLYIISDVNAGYTDYDELEFLDVTMTDLNKTTSRHEVTTRAFTGLGYEAIFESPYGQDQDFYYILNNSKCYKYY